MNRFASAREKQGQLLLLAGILLFLASLILTLAPAARERSWSAELRWTHWFGFFVWAIVFGLAHVLTCRRLPDADALLLPVVSFLSGWGLLTIYRLIPGFGIRQTIWLLIGGSILLLGIRIAPELHFLRRYKYIWLTGGLVLTALTLAFGTNPAGDGLRLWLGCCGVYLQPSEPLKFLFIVFLAAYFAERMPLKLRPLTLLLPTFIVMSIALLLLIVQRDLGTASIFIFLYTAILYVASGKKRVLTISLAGLALAGLAGYQLFDVVRLRVDAWLNPWLDPAGRSFQIVQSLMAVANGGTLGRGIGLGSPGLVPVAISDFTFAAMAEETGLAGIVALLLLFGLLINRGFHIALHAPDNYRRLLASGLTAHLGAQAILIMGGNIRLLPLTGVTLPFVSYGGSSLLTSFVAALILLIISSQPEQEPAALAKPDPYLLLSGGLILGLIALALTSGWWSIWRGPTLLDRTDNARRTIADRYVHRGSLLDRHEAPINITTGDSGDYLRTYVYPDLGPITGYTNAVFGQSGLEASLDPYLRGLQGNPARLIWWDHLLYGQPPPGLDIRLSLDLELQANSDSALGNHKGAVVLMNAATGEILAMASHPTFDPNRLDEQADSLLNDPDSPLLNRAAQALYPPGQALGLFYRAAGWEGIPEREPALQWNDRLGFYTAPPLRLPVSETSTPDELLRVSPVQMTLAAAALSNGGIRPSPRLATAINTPEQGWVILPALSEPVAVFASSQVIALTDELILEGRPCWLWSGTGGAGTNQVSWVLGGTLPDWQGTPTTVVVLLEEDNPELARQIAIFLLDRSIAR